MSPTKKNWRWNCYLGLVVGLATVAFGKPAGAQLIPDLTLGAEGSRVNQGLNINDGLPSERIEGGALRGTGLFHSFTDFNVNPGQRVYFANPSGAENIFSRVTGGNGSGIFGTLGVEGVGNLFLLNPNGILFGPGARLDIQGSFVASTGDRLIFENGGAFSAIDPQAPPLLTISTPLGLQYGKNPGNIEVRGASLEVSYSATLALVGGNVDLLENAQISADGGRIEIGAVFDGIVGLKSFVNKDGFDQSSFLTLDFPISSLKGTVTINQALLNTAAFLSDSNGGNIIVNAGSVLMSKASLKSSASSVSLNESLTPLVINVGTDQEPPEVVNQELPNLSDELLDRLDRFLVETDQESPEVVNQELPNLPDEFSEIDLDLLLKKDSGNIIINARNEVFVGDSSIISTEVLSGNIGNGGNIEISSGSLYVIDKARLITTNSGDGSAGNISIKTRDSVVFENGGVAETRGISRSNSGNIRIDTSRFSIANGYLNSSLEGRGKGGGIMINASESVFFDRSNLFNLVTDNAIGDGGDIEINSKSVNINQSQLSTRTFGRGDAGDIKVNSEQDVVLNTGVLFSSATPTAIGDAGDILINANSLFLKNAFPTLETQSSLFSGTEGIGDAGDITINTRNSIVFEKSTIFSRVFSTGVGNGGDLEISARSIIAENSGWLTGVDGIGDAGKVVINAQDSISFSEAGIYSNITSSGVGDGGSLTINTNSLSLRNGAQLFASTEGQGSAGDMTITARDRILVDGIGQTGLLSSSIFSSAERGAAGQGGKILINTPTLTVSNGAVINARTESNQPGGNITINANALETLNGGQILSTTTSSGQAGSITLNVIDRVTLSGTDPDYTADRQSRLPRIDTQGAASGLYVSASPNSTGQSGNIQINSNSLLLDAGAQIVASTDGQGNAGNITLNTENVDIATGGKILANTGNIGDGGTITINAAKMVNLGRGVQDFAPVISVETSGSGKAGDIVVTTPSLALSDTARITATATSTSTNVEGGGSIVLNASNMDLRGTVGIFAETQGSAPAGTLSLNPYKADSNLDIRFFPGSLVSASTSGSGNGGGLNLNASQSINLAGAGKLSVEASNIGNAGDIDVKTQQLTLSNGVELSASTSSIGKAGDINITATNFDLNSGAKLSTNTAGSGQAGNINLNVDNQLTLSGAGTGLFASTTRESSGKGGNIFIDPRSILVQNGGTIAVDSQGEGQGGNIEITSGRLTLRNTGSITAKTASSQGGNIKLNLQDILLLRRNSLISATAGTAQLGGDGGNIEIKTPFVISVLSENNDITANAYTGKGGSIDITTQRIFGLQAQPRLTPFSDITASSELGVQGSVTIDSLDIDPNRGLQPLPTGLVDPSNQIRQRCPARTNPQATSSFVITGRGGLPQHPGELPAAQFDTSQIRPTSGTNPSGTSPPITLQSVPVSIVEATQWQRDAAGKIRLIAAVPRSATPQPPECPPES